MIPHLKERIVVLEAELARARELLGNALDIEWAEREIADKVEQ